MTTNDESGIGNALVAQKDLILGLINSDKLLEATTLLLFVAELWTMLGYGYKAIELIKRIREYDACRN
jgi:hypothetical protein